MNRILISTAAFALMTMAAHAQPAPHAVGGDMKGMEMMMPMPNDSPATKGYKTSMLTMMHSMPAYTGDADVDFMKQMRGHHQAAIDMAKVVIADGKDAETKKLAAEIISAQEKEIVTIDAWLKKKGA